MNSAEVVVRPEGLDPEHRAACRSCSAPIAWAKTPTGKAMPVDFEPVSTGNIVLFDGPEGLLAVVAHATAAPGKPRHQAHFVSCPNAAEHRKARSEGWAR
jgi:hypothetical protein